MPVTVHGHVPAARVAEIERFVANHGVTERMFRDLDREGLAVAAIIEMDEYTHDIVVPLADGVVLVYDTT